MPRPRVPILLAIAVSILTGSCAPNPAPQPNPPTPTTTPPLPTANQTTTYPPPVTRVLDITRYANSSCTLFTPEQRATLGLTFEKGQSSDRNVCYLDQGPTPPTDVRLRIYISSGESPRGLWSNIRPPEGRWTTIGEQPAATFGDRYSCHAMVWTAPEEGVEVRVVTDKIMEERDDWCQRAIAILEPIVANLTH